MRIKLHSLSITNNNNILSHLFTYDISQQSLTALSVFHKTNYFKGIYVNSMYLFSIGTSVTYFWKIFLRKVLTKKWPYCNI